MPDVKRTVKIVTEQAIKEGVDSGVEGFPMRHWSIRVVGVHAETKQDVEADMFDKVTYNLHPSFNERAKQAVKRPPFKIEEDGWGEFELELVMTDISGKDHHMTHDLNFQNNRYEVKQVINFKNPKAPLLAALRNSGPVPGDAADGGINGANSGKKRQSGVGEEGKKKKRPDAKGVDMDKLAEGLQKLGEDDLLQVVQMVHDHKTEDSWMRNDADQGEFHVDLYTLPDNLIKMLWDFTAERVLA